MVASLKLDESFKVVIILVPFDICIAYYQCINWLSGLYHRIFDLNI